MSRAFGLVKFKKTGNIYYGCYNGTSDVMYPCLCTPEECRDEDGYYNSIKYCTELTDKDGWALFPDNISDIDEVEIYSDYGYGFWWYGTGSETAKKLNQPLCPWEENECTIFDGKPEWVEKFFEKQLEEMKRSNND